MSVRLIKLGLSDSGATPALGVNLTDAEVAAKTVVGPDQFTAAGIGRAYDICHDYSGNLYISDDTQHVIAKVNELSGTVTHVAGDAGTSGNNGTMTNVACTAARFNSPKGICCDKFGSLYVADLANNQIRVIKNNKVSVFAGKLAAGFVDGNGNSDTSSATAQFSQPIDVAVDKAGVVYVTDYVNHAVRKITNNGKVVTIAGNGSSGDELAENGTATAITSTSTTWPSRRAMFNGVESIAVDAQGNLYVYDIANIKLKKITPDGQVHLYSGSGSAGLSLGTNNPTATPPTTYANTCEYTWIYGIDPDESGNIYACDYRAAGRSRILKIDYNGRPCVIAEFTNTYTAGPWALCVTPGQAIYVVLNY